MARIEVVSCRLSPHEARALRERAHASGGTVSDELRRLIRAALRAHP